MADRKWPLSLADKNLLGCSIFLLPLQNVNDRMCKKLMENINFSDNYFQRYLIGNIILNHQLFHAKNLQIMASKIDKP